MAVFFFLLFVLVRARVWQVQVIEAGSKASGPLILFPYQQYNIFMTIGKDPSPVPDVEQTTEQVLIGQMPLLLDRDNEGAAQNTFGEVQPVRIHGQYGWLCSMKPRRSRVIVLEIESTIHGPDEAVHPSVEVFRVTDWFCNQEILDRITSNLDIPKHTTASKCFPQLFNLLGPDNKVTNSSMFTSLIGNGQVPHNWTLKLSAIPSISSAWAIYSSSFPHLSGLLFSSDEFKTTCELDIVQAVRMTGLLDKLGGPVCPGMEDLTDIRWWDVSMLKSEVFFATSHGVLRASRSIVPQSAENPYFSEENNAWVWTWERVLDKCIEKLLVPQQQAPYHPWLNTLVIAISMSSPQKGPQVFASATWSPKSEETYTSPNTNRIPLSQIERSDFIQLLDVNGRDMFEALSLIHITASIISGSSSLTQSDSFLFLVRANSSTSPDEAMYYFIEFRRIERTWVHKSSFPTVVSPMDPWTQTSIILSEEYILGEKSVGLTLMGMEFSRTLPSQLYVWGSAVLYSPNRGTTIMLIATFAPDELIVSASTSESGAVAFLSKNGAIWISEIGSPSLVRVRNAIWNGQVESYSMVSSQILFDEAYVLREVRVNLTAFQEGNMSEAIFSHALSSEIIPALGSNARGLLNKANSCVFGAIQCPYTSVMFFSDPRSAFTRYPSTSAQRELPHRVFLEMGESYTFFVQLQLSSSLIGEIDTTSTILDCHGSPWQPKDSDNHLSVWLADSKIKVNTVSIFDERSYSVVVNFTLIDQAISQVQYQPGENMQVSPIVIKLEHAGVMSCDSHVDDIRQLPFQTVYGMNAYSGCPPGLVLELDSFYSRQKRWNQEKEEIELAEGCNDTPDFVCVNFDNIFQPVFRLRDIVSDETVAYTGKFRLSIIGGGPTFESVRLYTEEERKQYNLGGNSAVYSIDVTQLDISDSLDLSKIALSIAYNQISWVCWPGSPCSGVIPVFFQSPDYYFQFEVQSSHVLEASYCDFTTKFYVRLHNLQLDFAKIISLNLGTMGILYVVLVFSYCREKCKTHLANQRILSESFHDHAD